MELTQEELRRVMDYNPDTGVFTWKAPARHISPGTVAGCRNLQGYWQIRFEGKTYKAHRLAWLWTHGKWPTRQIDHINGCREDNRLANLRDVSNIENCRNQARRCDNTSGTTGVQWIESSRKWVASIMGDKKKRYLGCFDNMEDAIAARKAAEQELNYYPNHGRD